MPSVRTQAAIIVCPPSSQQRASDTSPIRLGRSATPALDARDAQRRSQPGLSDDEPTVVPSLDARRTPLTCRAEPLPWCDPNRRTGYDPCRMTYVGYAEVMRKAIRYERRGVPRPVTLYPHVRGAAIRAASRPSHPRRAPRLRSCARAGRSPDLGPIRCRNGDRGRARRRRRPGHRGPHRLARRSACRTVRSPRLLDREGPRGRLGGSFEEAGECKLKGVPDRWRLHRGGQRITLRCTRPV